MGVMIHINSFGLYIIIGLRRSPLLDNSDMGAAIALP